MCEAAGTGRGGVAVFERLTSAALHYDLASEGRLARYLGMTTSNVAANP